MPGREEEFAVGRTRDMIMSLRPKPWSAELDNVNRTSDHGRVWPKPMAVAQANVVHVSIFDLVCRRTAGTADD